MIPFLPAWWKLAIGGMVLVALAGGAWKLRHGGLVDGRAEIQTQWTAEKLAMSENARLKEKALNLSTERIDREYQITKNRLAADKRRSDDSLRSFKAAINQPDNNASATSGNHGTGGLERELLGICATSFAEMGITADRLEAKVVGLQSYITNVCLAK